MTLPAFAADRHAAAASFLLEQYGSIQNYKNLTLLPQKVGQFARKFISAPLILANPTVRFRHTSNFKSPINVKSHKTTLSKQKQLVLSDTFQT